MPFEILISFLLFLVVEAWNVDGGLTLCFRLGAGFVGRTPKIHVRARDAGSPGEIDGVNIVEC